MLRNINFLKANGRFPGTRQPLSLTLRRTCFFHGTEKDYEHRPLIHPTDLKQFSNNEFHAYHKKVFQKVFNKEMPNDHLRDPQFTVFQLNPFGQTLLNLYYKYYLIAVGAAWASIVSYYYYSHYQIEDIQQSEGVSRKEALFIESLKRHRKFDVLKGYTRLKDSLKIKFSSEEAAGIFTTNYVIS